MNNMILSLELTDPPPIYRPGDMIAGIVKLTTPRCVLIDIVAIGFHGFSRAMFLSPQDLSLSNNNPQSTNCFLSKHQQLCLGSRTFGSGSYTFPFVIQIPEDCDGGVKSYLKNERFRLIKSEQYSPCYPHSQHQLPPTMRHRNSFQCSIEYVLQASLVAMEQDGRGSCAKLQARREIRLGSLARREATADIVTTPYIYHTQSFRKLAKNPLSVIRTQIGAALHRRSVHFPTEAEANFDIKISLWTPKSSVADKKNPILIHLSAQFETETYSDEQRPPVSTVSHLPSSLKISRFSVILNEELRAEVEGQVRKRKTREVLYEGSYNLAIRRSRDDELVSGPEQIPLVSNLAELSEEKDTGKLRTPDFSTENIVRSHSLDVKLHVEYMGKRVRFTLQDIPIRILPGYTRDRPPAFRVSNGSTEVIDKAPPAYTP